MEGSMFTVDFCVLVSGFLISYSKLQISECRAGIKDFIISRCCGYLAFD